VKQVMLQRGGAFCSNIYDWDTWSQVTNWMNFIHRWDWGQLPMIPWFGTNANFIDEQIPTV